VPLRMTPGLHHVTAIGESERVVGVLLDAAAERASGLCLIEPVAAG
jgi:hypothetical protein